MEKFTDKEIGFNNRLNEPINNVDRNLINSIINKMLLNGDYEELVNVFNNLI